MTIIHCVVWLVIFIKCNLNADLINTVNIYKLRIVCDRFGISVTFGEQLNSHLNSNILCILFWNNWKLRYKAEVKGISHYFDYVPFMCACKAAPATQKHIKKYVLIYKKIKQMNWTLKYMCQIFKIHVSLCYKRVYV